MTNQAYTNKEAKELSVDSFARLLPSRKKWGSHHVVIYGGKPACGTRKDKSEKLKQKLRNEQQWSNMTVTLLQTSTHVL